jgi:endo-1,4-beta-xylanase
LGGTILKRTGKRIALLVVVCMVMMIMVSCGQETVKTEDGADPGKVSAEGNAGTDSGDAEPGDTGSDEQATQGDSSGDQTGGEDSQASAGDSAGGQTGSSESSGNSGSPNAVFATIDFEDKTTQGFSGRGGPERLTVTDEANVTKDGKYSLKVEKRSESWHGPSLRIEKYVEEGGEYKFSAYVKLIEPASAQITLSTQIGSGSSATYANITQQNVSTGSGWVKLEGLYRYSMKSDYITIYIESSSPNASFYIDDISAELEGKAVQGIQTELASIKDVYKNDFLIGNAISLQDTYGTRLELLKKHHNVVTFGNEMKPESLQRTKGSFSFSIADRMVENVLKEGLKIHGHTLVWHSQSPQWMNQSAKDVYLSREEALENLRTHIKTVMEHFGDKVISWDVVNEAMNDNPSNPEDWRKALRQSPWYHAIGDDYVEQAFLAAREVLDAHPEWDIKLYYNDYNLDNQNKSRAVYSMVKELNEKYQKSNPGKLLIDGVGMQAHYSLNTNPANVELSLERFISLGVEVSITELDIMAGTNNELTEKQAIQQGHLYAELFSIFKKHSDNIVRVTFWGMDDGTSWRSSMTPTLFDRNLQAKPAYYGVIDPETFLRENRLEALEANRSLARYGTPVIDGETDTAWSKAPALQLNRYQMAWQGATGTARVLWDEQNLYVLIYVDDPQLDKANANPWEQDSVEVFVDENNAKTTFYQEDDGQYRVNYENAATFNPESISKGFESAVKVSGSHYIVEMKIPFRTITPKVDTQIGFDAQINDAKDGIRISVANWNDVSGNGYQDPSVFGILTLKK